MFGLLYKYGIIPPMRFFSFKSCGLFGTLLICGASLFVVRILPNLASAAETTTSTLAEPSGTSTEELSAIHPTIADDEIDTFLFHISESLEEKVKILDSKPVLNLHIPVLFNVTSTPLEDTWGEARSRGRAHKGTDIVAPRGEFVVSPTDAVVTNVGYGNLGGNYVLTANPGGEQFYYAHLDVIPPSINPGKVLSRGDLIGYVGNTGNAKRAMPHLHFAIYYKGIATNPFPRLIQEFSLEEKVHAIGKIIDESDTPLSIVLRIIDGYNDFINEAKSYNFVLPKVITWILENGDVLSRARMLQDDMTLKSHGDGVRLLQELLVERGAGSAARLLASAGITGYFGMRTQNAIAEYQKITGITPARGYFGPETRAHILNLLLPDQASSSPRALAQKSQKVELASLVAFFNRDLEVGAKGEDVRHLQEYLIAENIGVAAFALRAAGITEYFGELTRDALAEYQRASGITPALGYFGSITRAWLQDANASSTLL